MFGGDGTFIRDDINDVQVTDNFTITNTCNSKKCETESLFIGFIYKNIKYVLGGVTDSSVTCFDQILVKCSTNNLFSATDLLSGMFYCDITGHRPCFVSMKGNTHMNMNNRPKIRFGEKNAINLQKWWH